MSQRMPSKPKSSKFLSSFLGPSEPPCWIVKALAVEDDAIARGLAGQGDEDRSIAVGRHLADGLLLGEVDGIHIPVFVTGGAFDAFGEAVLGGEGFGDEEFLVFAGGGRRQ